MAKLRTILRQYSLSIIFRQYSCMSIHYSDNTQAIADAEKQAKTLKEEQRSVREAVNDNAKQTKM